MIQKRQTDYRYEFGKLPPCHNLVSTLSEAANRLETKLRGTNISELEISQYNQKYLREIARNLVGNLKRSVYLLSWAMSASRGTLSDQVLLEYGGGTGLLCLLAKEAGVGQVVYNDIYDVSCQDAGVIGEALHCKADAFIVGDIDDVIEQSVQLDLRYDAVVSYDCIEHIYDINGFLNRIGQLPGNLHNVVLGSGANPFNRDYVRVTSAMQTRLEHERREPQDGHKQRDTLAAYLDLRREIIQQHAPSISSTNCEELAVRTRGLMSHDIKQVVDDYLETDVLPKPPSHPTNTCDPLSGNWAEHLMDPYELAAVLNENGFHTTVRSGYFNCIRKSRKKRLKLKAWNLLIRLSTRMGLTLAPYYVLHAQRTK